MDFAEKVGETSHEHELRTGTFLPQCGWAKEQNVMSQKKPEIVDIRVGARIRATRQLYRMSQTALAERLGITFQQVQKYEKGSNRVGASRLQAIADVLGVPVADFFATPCAEPGESQSPTMSAENDIIAFLSTREGLELNRAFARIDDPKIRRKAVELLKAVVAASELGE